MAVQDEPLLSLGQKSITLAVVVVVLIQVIPAAVAVNLKEELAVAAMVVIAIALTTLQGEPQTVKTEPPTQEAVAAVLLTETQPQEVVTEALEL
jgi:hypothetical protein